MCIFRNRSPVCIVCRVFAKDDGILPQVPDSRAHEYKGWLLKSTANRNARSELTRVSYSHANCDAIFSLKIG